MKFLMDYYINGNPYSRALDELQRFHCINERDIINMLLEFERLSKKGKATRNMEKEKKFSIIVKDITVDDNDYRIVISENSFGDVYAETFTAGSNFVTRDKLNKEKINDAKYIDAYISTISSYLHGHHAMQDFDGETEGSFNVNCKKDNILDHAIKNDKGKPRMDLLPQDALWVIEDMVQKNPNEYILHIKKV